MPAAYFDGWRSLERYRGRPAVFQPANPIIHESVHAHLVLYFKQNGMTRESRLNYHQMIQAYRSQSMNQAQHDEMVRSYLGDIAAALKQYGQSKGYTLTDKHYFDLAWGGLDGLPDDPNSLFNRTYGNDSVTKNRIRNVINAERDNKNTNGISPKGGKACP